MHQNQMWKVRALALAVAGAGFFGISSAARATPFFDITDVGPGTLGAHDINSLGQITGGGLAAPGGITDAFLYTPGIGVQDLGRLNDVGSAGLALNDAGQVTGDSGGQAFLFSNGTMQDIGTAPGFTGGSAAGINASGQVAFDVVGFTTGFHAALFSNGTVTDLGTLGGPTSITAKTDFGERPINKSGQVVGSATTTPGKSTPNHAFLFSNGKMQDLGTLGGPGSGAAGINDAGQVTGSADTADGNTHAFLFTGGKMIDLGTLGGDISEAEAINQAGQVIGGSSVTPGDTTLSHSFLYSNGKLTDLGTFGGRVTTATGLNDTGDVVGTADLFGNTLQHGFLYTNGQLLDLNGLIGEGSNSFTITRALGINDAGDIVAYGTNSSDQSRLLELTPGTPPLPPSPPPPPPPGVPLPAPWAMSLLGLGAVAALKRVARGAT